MCKNRYFSSCSLLFFRHVPSFETGGMYFCREKPWNMKIIDNKKDYYDYLSGIYGIDDLIVFDRRNSRMLNGEGVLQPGLEECFTMTRLPDDKPLEAKEIWKLKTIHNRRIVAKAKKFHYNRTLLEGRVFHYVLEVGWNRYFFEVERWIDSKNNRDVCLEYRLVKSEHKVKNRLSDSPIFIAPCKLDFDLWSGEVEWERMKVDVSKQVVNPILSETYILKVIPPEEMWKAIYEFLSSQKDKPIVDTRNDIQKLESAGFDKKTSFRNM